MRIEQVFKLSKNKPAAMNCLLTLVSTPDTRLLAASAIIIDTIERLDITGTNLYVLYSDLCNKEVLLMEYLCQSVPAIILQEACNKQDYSSREMVAPYVEKYKALNLETAK